MDTGVRIPDMPNLGGVNDACLFVGERTGSGTFTAPALRSYAGSGAVSVKGFGAVGDGVTDDTAAINAALAASCAVAFPDGTYKVSGPLNIIRNGARVTGSGRASAIIMSNSTTADVFAMAPFLTGVVIEHMTIDRSVTATAGADGITTSESCEFCKFSDLLVQHQWDGVVLGPTGYSYVENVIASKNLANGFYLTNTAGNGALQWSFQNCLAAQNVAHGFLIAAQNLGPTAIALGEVNNCSSYANGQCGFAAVGVAGCPIYGVRILGGFFGADGNHEVFLDTYAGDHKIIGVFTELAGMNPTGPTFAIPASQAAAGFQFTGTNIDVQCVGCSAFSHARSGFISNAQDVTYSSCKAMTNGQALSAGDRSGFWIQSGNASLFATRAGNAPGYTTQQYGIAIADATPGVLIWGGDLRGNATLPIGATVGLSGLTAGGTIPSGNLLLPTGGVQVGFASGGPPGGGINVGGNIQKNGVTYNNP